MGLFSRKYRIYTWTSIINLAIGIAFVATAGVLWSRTDWGMTGGISQLAIGFLAVGLLALVVGIIAGMFSAQALRLSNTVSSSEATEEEKEETVEGVQNAATGEWQQVRVVEQAVEKWVDAQQQVKAGEFDYEINKMDKWTYYVNFFNEKNVRVYQLLIVPSRDKSSFDVSVSFARPDNKVPRFELRTLEKAINEQKDTKLALAE